jgi:acetyl esterase
MPLDHQVAELLQKTKASGAPPPTQMTVAELRQAGRNQMAWQGEPPSMTSVVDRRIVLPDRDISVRIFRPVAEPRPLLVYFHGGGWVRGDLDIYDQPCRLLARSTGCVVVSVDYRLAPENKYPAAVEDAAAATEWAAENALEIGAVPHKLAVGGDSSGGTLAAAVARRARDGSGVPAISYQLLIYPATDYCLETESYRTLGQDYAPTVAAMRMFWGYYLATDDDGIHPDASPLRASDLSGLPPACILTCEFDPLRDDGELYAARLSAAGVPVRAVRLEGLVHASLMMTGVVDRAQILFDQAGLAVREAFGIAAPQVE